MPHTPSPISHVSFHTRSHRPCRCMQKEHHPMVLWDCACLLSGATYHNLDAEKAIPFACAENGHQCAGPYNSELSSLKSGSSSLLLVKGWEHLQAKWRGKYQSQRIKKQKTTQNQKKNHSCDFTCLLVLSYPTVKSKYVPWEYASLCLHQTWKGAHVSRLHTAQIAFFPTLQVLY